MDMRSAVGRRVRRLRRDVRGWTLAEMANEVGISRSYLEKIESGRRDPSIVICERAAGLLGVSLVELVGDGATGWDGLVLETVARFRGLGVDPEAISAWLSRRPRPEHPCEQESPDHAQEPAVPILVDNGMSAGSGNGEGSSMARKAPRRDRIAVSLGRRITRLRRTLRPMVTQDALAARIGVSRAYVSKLERGDVDLPLSLAARVAAVLQVPIGKLVCEDGKGDDAEKWHRVALEACRTFSGLGMKPEEAAPSIRWLTNLLASYMRKGLRRK